MAALILLPVFFLPVLPIWHIRLIAPQYREGLQLDIYTTTVRGNLDTVNELNHYVGMHQIKPNEFAEFGFIPIALSIFGGLALLAALVNRRWFAALGWVLFTLFGVVMVADFGRWLWLYGHQLSPTAPIKMPPFTPPVIGVMRIANFHVQSWPGTGTIMLMVAWLMGPFSIRWEKTHPVAGIAGSSTPGGKAPDGTPR